MTPNLTILCGDSRETLRSLPSESVQCAVTSPPYWGLRNYGVDGQLGLEKIPEEYVKNLVLVFREIRRVLRNDGTVWLNLGDSYNSGPAGARNSKRWPKQSRNDHKPERAISPTVKPKDLIGIPWRVAFALQKDGWWLRSDIIWSKPNPMPESVRDRPTKSHEYIFLLTKSGHYFYDAEAIREPISPASVKRISQPNLLNQTGGEKDYRNGINKNRSLRKTLENFSENASGRNKRSVWTFSTRPYKGAHFATFPTDLVLPCVLAGTSEHGCCVNCGAPYLRIVKKGDSNLEQQRACGGWKKTCQCETDAVKPCTVLDPFGGSGTTGQVAIEEGRKAIICELNPKYIPLIEKRTHVTPGLQFLQPIAETMPREQVI
jgi:DNA modification methylase